MKNDYKKNPVLQIQVANRVINYDYLITIMNVHLASTHLNIILD